MLTPYDDYPVHQTALPVAHPASGDPNHYDRYWFNGYREDLYFAVGMGIYPNRGIIDAAFSVVHEGVQHSVFASGRMPADPTETRIGPLSIEMVEPLRVNRVRVESGEHGISADLTYTARTPIFEEPRQTTYGGARLMMDSTRATAMGTWTGTIRVAGEAAGDADAGGADASEVAGGLAGEAAGMELAVENCYGTKDRSWGVRPVGQQATTAPAQRATQVFFLWAPLQFADRATHFLVFENADGIRSLERAAVLPVLGPGDPVWGSDTGIEVLAGGEHDVRWAPGLRRSQGATLTLRPVHGAPEVIELEPLLTFRMRGLGYMHPTRGHGEWHDELSVTSERHPVAELDSTDLSSIHVQQVVRARWGERTGLGVLEQLAIGPHAPSGFRELLDGAPA